MSNNRIDNAPYLPTGDPLTSVETTKFRPGELGHVYIDPQGHRWQCVKAAGTLTHAAAVKECWYWTSAHGFVVDTDLTDSEATVNSVAGFLITGATIPTVNQHFWLLQEALSVTVSGANVNFQAGGVIVAGTVGIVTVTAAGTAPVSQPLGTVHTAVDHSGGAGDVVVDLNIASRLM